ncbi:MAG: calcium-binding protein [Rhodospirillales bacterium]|nr:calcium-binding protein [Rhodospirillales bacterium]
MTTPIILPGSTTAFGTAIDNTGTDAYSVYGAGNFIDIGFNAGNTGGNVQIFGNPLVNPYDAALVPDTNTTVNLKNGFGVSDTMILDGSGNAISSVGGTSLSGSTVTIAFDPYIGYAPSANSGTGGNSVSLLASNSSIMVSDGATSPTGGNSAAITNNGGTTQVQLTGANDTVTLLGDTANTVVTGSNTGGTGGGAVVSVGFYDDDNFTYSSSITVAGSNNTITGGDAAISVGGGVSGNTVTLGDGSDVVSLAGSNNSVKVGAGNDMISLGGGSSTVKITGTDNDTVSATWSYNSEDPGVIGVPNDVVNLSGSFNFVTATYANVTVTGSTGFNSVLLGNGNDNVTLHGDHNTVGVGNGTNVITLPGNSNTVAITDPTGVGADTINIGAGTSDTIGFDHAGGSVIGTGTGRTWITQAAGAMATMFINLGNGSGSISLGDGTSIIKANGNFTNINVGNGANNITALGFGDTINGGNGNDTVATGNRSNTTLGNGTDIVKAGNFATVTAGNGNDKVTVGSNSNVTLGDGNDTVSLGGGSTATLGHAGVVSNEVVTGIGNGITVNAPGDGNDSVTLWGYGERVNLGNGTDTVTIFGGLSTVNVGNGNGDGVFISGGGNWVTVGNGNNDTVSVGAGSHVTVGSGTGDSVTAGFGSSVVIDSVGLTSANDTVNVGDHSTVTAGSQTSPFGGPVLLANGTSSDFFYLNGLGAGSDIILTGSSNQVFIGENSSVKVDLNGSQSNDTVTVQAADATGSYTGTVEVNNFTINGVMDLQSLTSLHGVALVNYGSLNTALLAGDIQTAGGNTDLLLKGGGMVQFDGAQSWTASNFNFTNNFGPVHA